jgi:hypothetical protein
MQLEHNPFEAPNTKIQKPCSCPSFLFAPNLQLHLKVNNLKDSTLYIKKTLSLIYITMTLGGAFLRISATGLRVIEFACAAIVLGIYSYFLAVLARHDV